jgi:predicted transcriptional regulator of viral defense system
VFIYVPEQRFFGFEEVSVLGQRVRMATAERALLDAIDRPRYAGGISEVSRIASRASEKVSWEKLLDLLRKWGSPALVQRLGYYIALHQTQMPTHLRSELLRLVPLRSKILLGPRRKFGTSGKLIQPWNLIENVPRDLITSKDEKPRRRVVFPDVEPKR